MVVDLANRSLASPGNVATTVGVAWSGEGGGGCLAHPTSITVASATASLHGRIRIILPRGNP
jgi:hypothetical protein